MWGRLEGGLSGTVEQAGIMGAGLGTATQGVYHVLREDTGTTLGWQEGGLGKLAIELGNDINAHADFGDYTIEGDPKYLLLYYPLNMDKLGNVQGDPRWSGSTPLHAAVVSGQPGIVKYLIEHGAQVDAKTKLGWTPLMMAEGIFFANAKKEYPAAAAILKGK